MVEKLLLGIDLSASPSPRMQMSQWQSSISCMGSGTWASLGFSAIEKHWKMQRLNEFDDMLPKWKNNVPVVLVTLIPGVLRG